MKSFSMFCNPNMMQKLWSGEWRKKKNREVFASVVFVGGGFIPSSLATEGVLRVEKHLK